MIKVYDRAAMAHVLALDLNPQLRRLLERRFAALITPFGDLTDWTEWIILKPGDVEDDIVQEVGFSPLVSPIDGARFDEPGFEPFWDHLQREDGHYTLIQSFGSTFAYILIVPDADGMLPDLLRLCRQYAT